MARKNSQTETDSTRQDTGIITELHIPADLVVDTGRVTLKQKLSWYHHWLTALHIVAILCFFFIILALLARVSAGSGVYDFFQAQAEKETAPDPIYRLMVNFGVVCGLIAAASCAGIALIHALRPREECGANRRRMILLPLFLALLPLVMSGLLHFLWR